jgi:uncharacterized membrane protein YoaK (UPF0700 family)
MAQPPLSPQERRLAAFCRLSAVVYFAAGLGCAASPWIVSAPVHLTCWTALAVSLMTSCGTACLVTAAQPRERRHALLSVVIGLITAAVISVLRFGEPGQPTVFFAAAPLLFLTLYVYRSAAPGFRSGPSRGAAEAEEQPGPRAVQLGIKKAN